MANEKISQLIAGAPAVATDLLPIARSGSNYSLQVSDVLAGNAATASNLSGTPALPNGTTATTQSLGDSSTKLATTAYVATTYPRVVASRVQLAQSSVDGNATQTFYTIPAGAGGVYRFSAFAIARTVSNGACLIQLEFVFPSGSNMGTQPVAEQLNGNTGVVAANPVHFTPYLHAGDVITCGSVLTSGSLTGGSFEFNWIAERLF